MRLVERPLFVGSLAELRKPSWARRVARRLSEQHYVRDVRDPETAFEKIGNWIDADKSIAPARDSQ